MLKKRILASSMASVMALSTVSVVAFADETATSDIKTEVVTKAQLKEYVESLDDFVKDELDEYGQIQSEWLENAIDAAQAALDNRKSTDEDITAAYQMLKSVKENLRLYTQAELKELVAECKADYETENKYNEKFNDQIWKNDKDQFDDFESAYENADGYTDSEDSADLSDAYLELKTTHDALSEMESVTKSQFRQAYNAYADILEKFADYEGWRRGVCTVSSTTTNIKDKRDNKYKLANASYVTFDELKEIVYGSSVVRLWEDREEGRNRGFVEPAKGTMWIERKAVNGSTKATVQETIETAYDYFLSNADSNITTDEGIVKAYKAAVDAVKVFNGWEATVVRGSNERSVQSLLKDYRDDFLKACYANAFMDSLDTGSDLTNLFTLDLDKLELKPKATGVELTDNATLATINNLFINKNTGTFAYNAAGTYVANANTELGEALVADLDGKTGQIVTLKAYLGTKKLDANTNLMKYIPMTRKMIEDGAAGTVADAVGAVSDAEDVLTDVAAVEAEFKGTTFVTGKNYTAEEFALLTADLAENAANDATQYNDAIGVITQYYNDVNGAMEAAGFEDNTTYAQLVSAFETAYGVDGANAPTSSSNPVIEGEATAAKNYFEAVIKVVYQARAVVAAEKADAQATVDAGSENIEAWFGSLEDAMQIYKELLDNSAIEDKDARDFQAAVNDEVIDIDENNTVVKSGEKDAYALLVKYTTFALDNCFPRAGKFKTFKDILALCDKAVATIEKTGDAAFGDFKALNANLAEVRKSAIEWVAIGKAMNKNYYDGKAFETIKTDYFGEGIEYNANNVYYTLEGAINDLEDEYAEYEYSYGDIANTIAEVAAGLDAGSYGASAASIKAAAAEIAFTLSVFEEKYLSTEDDLVFDDDRNFLAYNRLRTKGGKRTSMGGVKIESPTNAEKDFKKKYEALLKAVEEASKAPEKPEVVLGDLDGDGKVGPSDAIVVMNAFLEEITLTDAQKAAADFNKDGVVNPADARAILTAYLEA